MSLKSIPWSLWILAALLVVLGLQVFPIPGVFLMIIGGALWAGVLVHVFLATVFVEAVVGRLPRVLLIVPLAAYGAYYAMYLRQSSEIAAKSAELRATNPGKIFDFDYRSESLLMKDAGALIGQYAVPVVYEANANFQPEGHLSYRLLPRDQCNIPKDTQNRIQTMGVHFEQRLQPVCLLQFPETPPQRVLKAERHGDEEVWKRKKDIAEQVTEISRDGVVLGSFRTASVWRLPKFPFMAIGCSLISSTPAWKCGADFMRQHTIIDAVPDGIDRAVYDAPLSIMLGLRKYTASDLAGFRVSDEYAPVLAKLAAEPGKVEDSAFDVLHAIVEGLNPKLPHNLGYSVARNPDRLAPFAAGMARRFVELNGPSAKSVLNAREQIQALAAAIPALPREAFMTVAAQIFDVIRVDGAFDRFPALYVRAADVGTATLDFYKRAFMAEKLRPLMRLLPVLAVCRIGQSDAEVIAEMKRQFVDPSDSKDQYEYRTALFVTLLKLGEEAFVRENLRRIPSRSQKWANAVLDKKGATEVGPNNCMPQNWPIASYVGPVMAARLDWKGQVQR